MTVANIQSGFRKTGIYPMNFEAIDKEKFTPSSVTDSKHLENYNLSFPLFFQHSLCVYVVLMFLFQLKYTCLDGS